MKRRGNKSSKVPNVKLRPAQAGAVSRPPQEASTWWVQDSQLADDDTFIGDTCPRPFKGFVICATGVLDKPSLFKQAMELGATPSNPFTDRVTHLVAVDHGGPKYMCALERKVPILKPSWITESYKVWLHGDDVDLQQSIAEHRLPIFSGVVLSPSGITDITRRTQINKALTAHQGIYVKNLERPVKVTHLLCSGDEETDKMRYAEKFNSRGEAQIHLVWEEWFWDSLEFGGRFDEEKYQVRHPRPERKSLIIDTPSSPPPSSSVLPSEQDPPSPNPAHISSSRPNQGDDDTEEEIAAVKKRVPAMTLQLWESLLKPRGFEINGGQLLRSPSRSQGPSKLLDDDAMRTSPTRSPLKEAGDKNQSVIASFRRANSFATFSKDAAVPPARQPFRRTATAAAVLPNRQEARSSSFMAQPEKLGESSTRKQEPPTSSIIFAGLKFRALGEAKSPSVRNAIEGCGGKMVPESEADEDVDYILVRLVSGSKFYRDEGDESERTKYRTECWLERCIFEERICSSDDHISFAPLSIDIPVLGADNVYLSFSGLDQSEACWVRRLIRAFGINLEPNFSRRSTHLLCPSGTGAKFDKAREWGIPVINMAWLAEIATTGTVPSVSDFLVSMLDEGGPTFAMDVLEEVLSQDTILSSKGKGKRKAKETDTDFRMHDITNKGDDADNLPNDTSASEPVQQPPRDTHLERRHTAPQGIAFGQPTGLLSTPIPSQRQLPTSSSLPPLDRSATLAVNLPMESSSGEAGPSTSRRPTQAEIEQDRKSTRIPSSKSPSPMKIPRSRNAPVSPAKVPNEVTRALQDNIASLLGKRQPSDEGEILERTGKKARPQTRSKPQSRQPSDPQIGPSTSASGLPPGVSLDRWEGYDELSVDDNDQVEESMRVTYEDPGQRAEKNRLMSLFGSPLGNPPDIKTGGSASGKKGRVKRSTRLAGF